MSPSPAALTALTQCNDGDGDGDGDGPSLMAILILMNDHKDVDEEDFRRT